VPLLHVIVLAIVQGITEFLPISSSGHLVLVWAGLDAQGLATPGQTLEDRLALDIAVHVGTLFAVCLYFWREILSMLLGLGSVAKGRPDEGGMLAIYIAVATLPLIIIGFAFKDLITLHLRNVEFVAWATICFGLLLHLSDQIGTQQRRLEQMTWGKALFIGIGQVLALVPGTSRSGITMTMARFLGFERSEAARFSLLLAIPAILGPGLLIGVELYQAGQVALGIDAAIAAALAFVFGYATILLLIGWLRRASFTPFVVYRLLLGCALLYWVYAGS
jgi:undecaprenyl-diphosphatase